MDLREAKQDADKKSCNKTDKRMGTVDGEIRAHADRIKGLVDRIDHSRLPGFI